MAALTMDSDMDFAFQLQLLEAINASLSLNPSASSASSTLPTPSVLPKQKDPPVSNNDVSGTLPGVQLEEIRKFEQEIEDRLISQAEFRKIRDDLHRRLHDQKLAQEIQGMPEDQWEDYGDDYERPYREEGSSKSIANETFRIYFKGMVETIEVAVDKNEKGALRTEVFAGIGVAITDSRDQLIVEIRKPLSGDGMSKRIAGIKALIEGLNTALFFDLPCVELYCDHFPLIQFVTGKWVLKQRKIAALMEQVTQLRNKFSYCQPVFVSKGDMKFAFKLAKEAIVSQISRPAESSGARKTYEQCVICLEDKDANRIFSVDDCMHRYCYSCMKQHVEVKLLHGMLPKCPHEGCNTELNVDGSSKFLTPKLLEIMKQRIKEASIPSTEKIYCPIKKCSALMSKSEVREYSFDRLTKEEKSAGERLCKECNSSFCINCKVPWHSNMSCSEFKKRYPGLAAEETKLKRLAATNLWRQCKKCNHMIELSTGCYHITCRCGYEFCYTCGSEWKNKKATCTCPLWDDEYIMDEESEESDSDYESNEESDYYEDFDDEFLESDVE